jgi:non-specific serine/threonine protein kinase
VWLSRLDLERENILSAHRWCDRADGGAEMGLRLVSAVKPYWFNRGLLGLGYRVTVEALARARAQERNFARSRGLFDAGQLGSYMGRYEEAKPYLDESLAIARDIGDQRRVALVLQPLGLASMGLGDLRAARNYLEEALALAEQQGNKREIAAALNMLAQLHRIEGALDAALPLYERGLSLARDLEDRESIAIGLLNLAIVSIGRGAAGRAQEMLRDALAIAEEIGSKRESQSVLEISTGLAGLREEWTQATRFFGAAEAQAAATGLHRDPADEAFLAPWVAKVRAALHPPVFAAAEARALTFVEANAEARAWLLTR